MNTETRYGTVAIALHWIIALLIIGNLGLGYYFNGIMDHHDAARTDLIQFHRSIGLTVLVLSVARLAWRLFNPAPPLPAGIGPAKRMTAHVTHFLLYFFIIAVPLVGWLHVSEAKTDVPTHYFGLFAWPNIGLLAHMTPAAKAAWHHVTGLSHAWLAYSALLLVLLHIGAALYHQFIRKDAVLPRMLPGSDIP
ncbi:MAG TPA: cytochrome b [Rhizomicrobium sp.]|jgi:cytochrome b561